MPHYIVLWNWTEQGIRTVKDGPKRSAALKAAVEKAGGKMVGQYVTFGQYDGIAIFELPNDEIALSLLLSIGIQGSVHTTTLKAFPVDEVAKIVEKLP